MKYSESWKMNKTSLKTQKHKKETDMPRPNIDIDEDLVNENVKKHFDIIAILDMTLILGY